MSGNFWIPTLIAAALLSLAIGLYVGLGRRSATTPAGGAARTPIFPFWRTWWFRAAVILILLALAGAYLLPFIANIKLPEGVGIPSFHFVWNTPFWLFVAGCLIIMSFILSGNLKRIAFAIGVGVLLLTFAISGFGQRAATEVTNAENCVAYKDCGTRSDDFSIIDNGTVRIPVDGELSFYVIGTVRLQNELGHCLNISPTGRFAISATEDGRNVFINPGSGKKVLATVTSLRAGEGDCR